MFSTQDTSTEDCELLHNAAVPKSNQNIAVQSTLWLVFISVTTVVHLLSMAINIIQCADHSTLFGRNLKYDINLCAFVIYISKGSSQNMQA